MIKRKRQNKQQQQQKKGVNESAVSKIFAELYSDSAMLCLDIGKQLFSLMFVCFCSP